MSNPTYRIEFRALASPIDPDARLQRLLKAALRSYGFRCKRIEEITSTVTKSDTVTAMASTVSNGEAGQPKADT